MRRFTALLAAASLAGCSLAPAYVRPDLPVPPSWPVGDAYLRQSEAALPSLAWRDVFRDPRLQALINQALVNNRDLRVAVANIAAARAQYRIQRADLLPEVGTSAGVARSGGGSAGGRTSFSVDAGVTGFEADLFGRVRSLTGAAQNRYFGQEAAARATRLVLVGDIATAWFNYAADASLLRVAEQTAPVAQSSVRLTAARLSGGIAPRTDLAQAQTVLAGAQSDLASQRTAVAQDVNALQLLVGAPIDPALLPTDMEQAASTVAAVPAGLDSSILLRRPDVVQAEYALRAFNAEIGAARAELFPRLSLTGLIGLASSALTGLFTGGAFNYSASAGASYSIFRAGAGRAGVAYSQAQRDSALASYERAIQSAFRETADALAREGTLAEQLRAERAGVAAARVNLDLTNARYRGGIDTFLASLDAQRSFYSAQQSLVRTLLVGATNRATLYRVLGGDSTLEASARGPVPVTQPGAPRTDEPLPPANPSQASTAASRQ